MKTLENDTELKGKKMGEPCNNPEEDSDSDDESESSEESDGLD